MREVVEILGVNFDFVDMRKAVEIAKKYAIGDRLRFIFTPNPEIVMSSQKDEELKKALDSADMVVPDGIGIVLASVLYGKRLPERVAGFDLVSNLISWGAQRGWSFYLLGGKPGVVEKAKRKLKKAYPKINIIGMHDGYFKGKEEEVIAHINLCNPNVLLVGMGAPLQEKWIFNNRLNLSANLAIGVGGAINIFAGKAKRAPKIFIELGLEWFYRLVREPWRVKRMAVLPVFLLKVIIEAKLKSILGGKKK